MTFSQLNGRFRELSLYDDTISRVTNRIVQREGVLDDETCRRLKKYPVTLSERQAADVSHIVSANDDCYASKQLDYVSHISDDSTYVCGDICYSSSKNLFGVVTQLLTIDGAQFADLQLYHELSIDPETNIPHANNTPSDLMFVEQLCKLSEPLVTAVDGDSIWFISADVSNNFIWMNEHLTL